jgi:hypothetical protein
MTKTETKVFCYYQLWNREEKKLESCGIETDGESPLCAEHALFVKDSTEGPFTASKKAHPAYFNWAKKARAAYGVVSPNMKPSDAGKPAHNPEERETVISWKPRFDYDGKRIEYAETTVVEPAPVETIITPGTGHCVRCGAIISSAPLDGGLCQYCADHSVEEIHATIETPDGYSTFEGVLMPYVTVTEPGQVAAALDKLDRMERTAVNDGPWTRESIETACARIMREKDTYKGTGISPILWSIGFQMVYRGKNATEKQIAAVRAIVAKSPAKYEPIFA